MRLTQITYLVVHCSDTPDDADISAAEIHELHLGFGWDGVGYHNIITRDGTVHPGRPEFWQGAHVQGQNHHSLGVCLIGRTHFTSAQFASLERLLNRWTTQYPDAQIVGHRDIQLEHKKTCPNFDAGRWWASQSVHTAESAYVIAPYTGLFARPPDAPDAPAEALDTECLYGELVQILDGKNHHGYLRARAEIDGYEGWVAISDIARIAPASQPDYVIKSVSATVTRTARITSASVMCLPMGSRCKLVENHGDMAEIELWGRAGNHRRGFVAVNAISQMPEAKDWVAIACQFIGSPYKWGGRTYHGLDCSALIQLSLQASGVDFMRDTSPQYQMISAAACSDKTAFASYSRGDLIYWHGHVGVMIDENQLLHANGFHHAVALEPVADAIARIASSYGAPIAHIRADRLAKLLCPIKG